MDRNVAPLLVCACVYSLLQDTWAQYVSPSVLSTLCAAAGGGCVQAENRTKKTRHIKGVLLVEYDYQPLSCESASPPSTPASLTGMGRDSTKENDFLNTSWPQTDLSLLMSSFCFLILLNGSFFLLNFIEVSLKLVQLLNALDSPHQTAHFLVSSHWF